MTARRWYAPTVLALLACGGLIFFAASRTWLTATVTSSGLPSDVVDVTGGDAQPIVPALGLVIAAAGLAVLATRGRLRQFVGLLTFVVGVMVVIVVLAGDGTRTSTLTDAIEQSTAFTGDNSPPAKEKVLWPGVVVVAAVAATVLGAITVLAGRSWPSMSGRYEAPGRPSDGRPVDLHRAEGADLWKALDEGEDPTV